MAPLCSTSMKDPPSLANGLRVLSNSARGMAAANQQAVSRVRMSRRFESPTCPALVVGNRRSLPRPAPPSEGYHLRGERALSQVTTFSARWIHPPPSQIKTDFFHFTHGKCHSQCHTLISARRRVSVADEMLSPPSKLKAVHSRPSVSWFQPRVSRWARGVPSFYFSAPRPVFRSHFCSS